MKKLVVLMLVLGIVTMANAGLVWSTADNGDGTFNVSLTPTADTEIAALYINALDAEVSSITSMLGTGLNNLETVSGGKTYGIHRSIGGVEDPLAASGDNLLSYVYTGSAGDTINVLNSDTGHPSLADSYLTLGNDTQVTFDSFDDASSVTMVPEPLTLGLLGLGGLFIRRRK
jgi:hypothetical protein